MRRWLMTGCGLLAMLIVAGVAWFTHHTNQLDREREELTLSLQTSKVARHVNADKPQYEPYFHRFLNSERSLMKVLLYDLSGWELGRARYTQPPVPLNYDAAVDRLEFRPNPTFPGADEIIFEGAFGSVQTLRFRGTAFGTVQVTGGLMTCVLNDQADSKAAMALLGRLYYGNTELAADWFTRPDTNYLQRTAAGRGWADLYRQHGAEVVRLFFEHPSLFTQSQELVGTFQPGVIALLAGRGDTVPIYTPMITKVNDFWNALAEHAALP